MAIKKQSGRPMGTKGIAWHPISTTISVDLYDKAKLCGIRWHDALARGVEMLSKGDRFQAELEGLKEKVAKLSDILLEKANEINRLEQENEKLKNLLKSHNIRLDVLEEKKQEEATKE
jgi:hypothetical protein